MRDKKGERKTSSNLLLKKIPGRHKLEAYFAEQTSQLTKVVSEAL